MGHTICGLAVLYIAGMIRVCAASSEATAEDGPIASNAAPDSMRPGILPSSTECHVHQTELERALRDAEELERQLVDMQVRFLVVVKLRQGGRRPGADVAVPELNLDADVKGTRACVGVLHAYDDRMPRFESRNRPPVGPWQAPRCIVNAALHLQRRVAATNASLHQQCRVATVPRRERPH
jgi:hypothetical protein